jgi:phosphoglycerate dehydrogenase-like enzyme
MTRVLILLTLPHEVSVRYRDRLRAAFPDLQVDLVDHYSKVEPYIGAADALLTFGPMLRDEVIRKAGRLRWIQALGTGVDNIVDLPSLRPETSVTNIRGIHGAALSEAAICSMLALTRRLPRAVRSQDRRSWERWPSALIEGKTVGVLGVGAIAGELAPRCKALGMRVIGISSAPERRIAGFDEMRGRDGLAAAVGDLDFLVLLTPLTAETRHIVGGEVLAAMRPTSCLVNLARGGVVDEAALEIALAQGRIAGAALDVFEEEPLPQEHPFWSMENVILTPHLGGFYDAYVDRAMPIILHNMGCFLSGRMEEMTHVVRLHATAGS